MKIGFFDSGLGGLSIMRAVEEHMPFYEYVFYGDTANLPYGDKTEREVYELTRAGIGRLFGESADLVIVACNTASAETLRKLQDTYLFTEYPDKKVLGVIIPTVEEIIERKKKHVMLIGTRRTVESGKYQVELYKTTVRGITLHSVATPELVPLIESARTDDALDAVSPLIRAHVDDGGDGLVLACTHYTLLKEGIRERYPSLEVFSQDEIIPKKLARYLEMHPEIETKLTRHTGDEIQERLIKTE